MLGPGAIGGEDGGGSGDRAVGESGRRVRFRELTPHEMLQTPEGKFSVSVWRKNKQVCCVCVFFGVCRAACFECRRRRGEGGLVVAGCG